MMSLTIACTETDCVHCLICLHRSDRNTSGVNVWRWPLLFIQWLTMQRSVPVVVCLWAGRCCLAPVGRTFLQQTCHRYGDCVCGPDCCSPRIVGWSVLQNRIHSRKACVKASNVRMSTVEFAEDTSTMNSSV